MTVKVGTAVPLVPAVPGILKHLLAVPVVPAVPGILKQFTWHTKKAKNQKKSRPKWTG